MTLNEQAIFNSYPLLSLLSEEQVHSIDLNVLWVPSKEDQTIIDALSKTLEKHIVFYNGDYEPKKGHLCRLIQSADLDTDQINYIKEIERQLSDQSKIVVVYEKPLKYF